MSRLGVLMLAMSLSNFRIRLQLLRTYHPIVVGMTADPDPDEVSSVFNRYCTVGKPDSDGPKFARFLELQ